MLEMAKEQLDEAQSAEAQILDRIRIALLPKDPNDDKNIFLEIRPGAGGDESGLFGSELLRMYLRYAERNGWRAEMIEHDLTGIGSLKFAMVKVSGEMVYSKLKFETGVHRVQRIPDTESNGRIHTSTSLIRSSDLKFLYHTWKRKYVAIGIAFWASSATAFVLKILVNIIVFIF